MSTVLPIAIDASGKNCTVIVCEVLNVFHTKIPFLCLQDYCRLSLMHLEFACNRIYFVNCNILLVIREVM
jgi:hypothetical protein